MPGRFLTEAERERLRRCPAQITPEDVIAYFTLTDSDLRLVGKRSGDYNRLSFALELCALRYPGFAPSELSSIPSEITAYVARQIGGAPQQMLIAHRGHTRRDQRREVQAHLGFRRATIEDMQRLAQWVLERALEHERPTLLLQLACEYLLREKIVRPGVTRLERLIATARERAGAETYARLALQLPEERRGQLDRLLMRDGERGRTPLIWMRESATANTAKAILGALEKITCLRGWGVDSWDLTHALTPNRQKFFAQVARKSTAQALSRAPPERRHPILLAFLRQTLVDVIDECLDLFDRCPWQSYANAGRELEEFRQTVARATNEKVYLFQELASIILDPAVTDEEVRDRVYQAINPEALREAVEDCARIVRPLDDNYFDLLGERYGYFRQFVPSFLRAFDFCGSAAAGPLPAALEALRQMDREKRRKVPGDAPVEFIAVKWKPYVMHDAGRDGRGDLNRRYYELCALWELRNALRAGDVWVEGSRRYANPESYLIPQARWSELRPEACRMIRAPEDGAVRVGERQSELEGLLAKLDEELPRRADGVRIEDGALVVPRLKAEEPSATVAALEAMAYARLPRLELTDLLIETDGVIGYSAGFTHAGAGEPRAKDLPTYLHAAVAAQALNFGPVKMAEVADLSYRRLAWTTTWYLREETLRACNNRVVNYQHHLALARVWGGGTLSSSDGQRFPVAVRAANAVALPRYFGYGRGLTFYTWTSDQHSQYGTKVTPTTMRDSAVVLDEILDNETELEIAEHVTDTAGTTDIIFALFDLLGLQFSPRIRDLADQRLYRIDRKIKYRHLEPLLKGRINCGLILRQWDDMLRVAGSLILGWVTASLLISKLQSFPRQNSLARAPQEYGRVVKTIFILKYLQSEEYRRRIGAQINKGEALHALRRFLFLANEGQIRKRHREEQANQASCLNLVTNAVVTWNTIYMQAAIEQLKSEGVTVDEADVAHLSPARYAHVNAHGKYRFDVEGGLAREGLRELRRPGEADEERALLIAD